MLRRTISLALIVWALGFVLFAVTLPGPVEGGKTDGVAVPTGAGGRIERGLAVIDRRWSVRMLVSGVDPEVKPGEFLVHYKIDPLLMACCITLGFQASDTRSNAREITDWMNRNHYRSVRLVTTDWHMRRAAYELDRILPEGITVIRDAVPSRPSFATLFLEYHKLIANRVGRLVGA